MFLTNETIEKYRERIAEGHGNQLSTHPFKFEIHQFIERTRFIEISDAASWIRREHLLSIFGPVDFHEISSSSVAGLLQADSSYDIMVVSVDDVQRLRHAILPPSDILVKKKLSFAYSSRTSPKMRAKLLRLGFDDALHAKMTPLEIIIRIESAISRTEIYKSNVKTISDDVWKLFCEQHVTGHLQKRQIELLQALVAASGEVVPYSSLASFDFTTHQHRFDSLKVTVSKLRKVLVGCDIAVARGRGYFLTYDQPKSR